MIVGSLLLIVVAVALLVLGLGVGSSGLLVGSIVASLIAALALIIGARQEAERRSADGYGPLPPEGPLSEDATHPGSRHADVPADDFALVGLSNASRRDQPATFGQPGLPDERYDPAPPDAYQMADPAGYAEVEPPDEPGPQALPRAAVARLARMATDVLVIDGRPRYHLPGCVHLLNRDSEPLPVGEAVELGFTPCGLCEPASALLSGPRQG